MANRPVRFRAEVHKQGPNFYVEIPSEVSVAFAPLAVKGCIRVFGTLEGAEIRGNLVPRRGGHWLYLHSGMRAASGVGAGEIVDLSLRATPWDKVPIARDVATALERTGASEAFEAKSPSQRHELLRWIDIADSAERRAERLATMVKEVLGEAKPAKKGQAAKRLQPLWKCSKCGHIFVNKNQWHSCKRYTLAQPFAKSSEQVRRLFKRLRKTVESVGPVHLQAYRDHVAFLVRVRFMSATPKRNWLDIGFWLPRRVDSPRFHKVETLTPTDHVHLLRVTEVGQLDDEVMGWIREGYEVGQQKHLT